MKWLNILLFKESFFAVKSDPAESVLFQLLSSKLVYSVFFYCVLSDWVKIVPGILIWEKEKEAFRKRYIWTRSEKHKKNGARILKAGKPKKSYHVRIKDKLFKESIEVIPISALCWNQNNLGLRANFVKNRLDLILDKYCVLGRVVNRVSFFLTCWMIKKTFEKRRKSSQTETICYLSIFLFNKM